MATFTGELEASASTTRGVEKTSSQGQIVFSIIAIGSPSSPLPNGQLAMANIKTILKVDDVTRLRQESEHSAEVDQLKRQMCQLVEDLT
ncbi:hypothetical protein ACH5RR_039454 [Cinchona calisaya]|uniref:Uncharacterized protein n=1 Tax=Cinchona calisaya TaxID=153742 RepID=A0ABD2XYA5_9GENT